MRRTTPILKLKLGENERTAPIPKLKLAENRAAH